jgi:nitrogen fixation NifU-like protein
MLMDRQQHIDLILDHYQHPRHRGALRQADITCTAGNPGCGDVVTVHLAVEDPDRRVRLSFDGEGCTVSMAAASMVTEMMQGWALERVESATPEPVFALLGPEIASARERCATLAFNTVKEACRDYRRQQLGDLAGL